MLLFTSALPANPFPMGRSVPRLIPISYRVHGEGSATVYFGTLPGQRQIRIRPRQMEAWSQHPHESRHQLARGSYHDGEGFPFRDLYSVLQRQVARDRQPEFQNWHI
jgi:hypothetical protein